MNHDPVPTEFNDETAKALFIWHNLMMSFCDVVKVDGWRTIRHCAIKRLKSRCRCHTMELSPIEQLVKASADSHWVNQCQRCRSRRLLLDVYESNTIHIQSLKTYASCEVRGCRCDKFYSSPGALPYSDTCNKCSMALIHDYNGPSTIELPDLDTVLRHRVSSLKDTVRIGIR